LKKPTEDFVLALREKLGKKMPEFMFEPKKSIFRIHRDTRFSDNKKPYKNNIAFFVRPKLFQKGVDSPGFYFHLEPKEVFIGGGQYIPSSQDLMRIRERIEKDPKSLKKILQSSSFKKMYGGLPGEKLKRAPKGFSPDHPDIELLRLKQWHTSKELEKEIIFTPDLVDVTADAFIKVSPLVYWIMDTVRYKAFLLA
ncbi:MAG: DUF2461 domain-containing protein, partial [Bdellovibrionales bacterium]|nr:DUF2461 domain-containing protein [Bdellovibrionales bacterium]